MLQFIAGNVEDFDAICPLGDDFYEKSIFFHISVGFYPSREFSRLLLTICKRQFSVSCQIFQTEQIKQKHRKCTLPELFRSCFII